MELDSYHYHEVIDRTHVIQTTFDDHIASHPVIVEHPELQAKVDEIQSKLMELYQEVGKISYNLFEK